MSIRKRPVRVHEVPEELTPLKERAFLRELQKYAESERPRLVLDCSRVTDMHAGTISLLLSALELVMKCNGDVRLASLTPEAEADLRSAGVIRLFEVYATVESAIHSFHQRAASLAPFASEKPKLPIVIRETQSHHTPTREEGSGKSRFWGNPWKS
ncbi:MAG TPA: STAS domain-containing protein [Acidisarcina sp.]